MRITATTTKILWKYTVLSRADFVVWGGFSHFTACLHDILTCHLCCFVEKPSWQAKVSKHACEYFSQERLYQTSRFLIRQ